MTPKGISCPHCRGVRLVLVKLRRPCPGQAVRSRACAACGTRVVTVEHVVRTLGPRPAG